MTALACSTGVFIAVGVGIGVGDGKGVGVGNTVGEGNGVGEGKKPLGVGLAVGEGFTVTMRRGEIWQPDKNTTASSIAALLSRTCWAGPLLWWETPITERMLGHAEALAATVFAGRRRQAGDF